MNSKIFFSMMLAIGVAFTASTLNNASAKTPKKTEMKAPAVKYTCPMHPEVILGKPGKCPKCGMTLVEKKQPKKQTPAPKDTTKMKHNSSMPGMKM
jgi:hypothetical protein